MSTVRDESLVYWPPHPVRGTVEYVGGFLDGWIGNEDHYQTEIKFLTVVYRIREDSINVDVKDYIPHGPNPICGWSAKFDLVRE